MLKLYRTTDGVTEYWEAWEDTPTAVIVHWGKIGNKGEMRTVSHPATIQAAAVIHQEAEPAVKDGFKPIAPEKHDQIVIQFKMHGNGSRKDFDRAAKIEALMNETLGWTGLGHCDGNDIGSGEFNIFCEVVDASVACPIVIADLKQDNLLEDAVIAYRVRTQNDDYSVAWPQNHPGPFQLI